MHQSVMDWFKRHMEDVQSPVLEVGSLNVNGSVRDWCPEPYWGVDLIAGDGVDEVLEHDLSPLPDGPYRTVICFNTLEHALSPPWLMQEMARVLAPGGLLLVNCCGPCTGYHHPPDRWRVLHGALSDLARTFGLEEIEETPDGGRNDQFLKAWKPPHWVNHALKARKPKEAA